MEQVDNFRGSNQIEAAKILPDGHTFCAVCWKINSILMISKVSL